nr:unnamed protein product [Digitaria exilis]
MRCAWSARPNLRHPRSRALAQKRSWARPQRRARAWSASRWCGEGAEEKSGGKEKASGAEAAEDPERQRVGQRECRVVAGERVGGLEEGRDGGVQRGRGGARVEGDEGGERRRGGGEAAGHDEVRVEREEEVWRWWARAGEDRAERSAQRRHLLAAASGRWWRAGGPVHGGGGGRGDLNVCVPDTWGPSCS